MVYTNGNEIVDAYTNGVQVIAIFSNGVQVWPPRSPQPSGNEIYYTSTDYNIVTPYRDGRGGSGDDYTASFGSRISTNTYLDIGVITFDSDISTVSFGFMNCNTLETIILPSGVTTIGTSAFDSCIGLTSITIPEGVTTIGWLSFSYCTSLPTITLPSTVNYIRSDAFRGCSSLMELIVLATVPPSLELDSQGRYVFYNTSPNLLIKVPASSLNDYLTAPGWSDYASQIVGYSNTDEIDFTTLGLANTQVVDVDTYGPFSSGDMEVQFTTTNQTYVSKYYSSGTAVRVYRENSVVISSSKTISQIKFTWTGGSSYRPSSDVATPSGYDYQTYIWTGSANQVTLTRPNESNHWRLKSVLVTYQ